MPHFIKQFKFPDGSSIPNQIENIGANNEESIFTNGTIGLESSSFNKNCNIINGYNFNTYIYDSSNIFGVQGIISFNEAITRVNNQNLTRNQLYTLYITRNITVLSTIIFGPKFSDLSNAPIGRATIDCRLRDTYNINDVINVNNFQWFTDLKYVANNYRYLLNIPGVASSGLRPANKTILNKFLYKNLFPESSKRKKYAYLATTRTKHINRIIPNQFVINQETCKTLKMRFN